MICLGIETTAHTFGIGIVTDKKKVLANAKDSYTTEEGGMIPIKAAEHHVEVCDVVLKEALKKADIKLKDIDLISFSQGPGMGHCLRIGAFFARALALRLNKPIIGVNHCIAHLSIGKMLNDSKDPVLLYASGANTQIIAYEGKKYRIFGETLDIGIGNFLDTFARYLGLGFPGGPKIDILAKKGKKLIELPYTVKGMDVSFGGLLTNLKRKHQEGHKDDNLAYSCQETAFAMLMEVTERALAHCNKKELLLGGGVACNSRLQEMAKIMCKERGAKCFTVQNEFNVDNGAMIAWQGILQYKAGTRMEIKDTQIMPYQRTDDIKVNWI
jgi:N6-L-threonylcarbamoyladenine synthase